MPRAHQAVDARHHRAILAPHLPDTDGVGALLRERGRRQSEQDRGDSGSETGRLHLVFS